MSFKRRMSRKKLKEENAFLKEQVTQQALKNVEPLTAPLFEFKISMTDVKFDFKSAAIAALNNVLGENEAMKWHTFYREKFEELIGNCVDDKNKLILNHYAEKERKEKEEQK